MNTLRWRPWFLAVALACAQEKSAPARRAEIRKLTGDTIELLPSKGQLPYCLIFTASAGGVVRQLTMARPNVSIRCEVGRPIGKVSYRIPIDEGAIKALVFFSDRRLNAASVAEQVVEMTSRPAFNAMDFRLPGQVTTEILEFAPQQEGNPTVGEIVGPRGSGDTSRDAGLEPKP